MAKQKVKFKKSDSYVEQKNKQKEQVRHSTNSNNSISRIEKRIEKKRLEDRGVY